MLGYYGLASSQLDDKYRFRIPSKFFPKAPGGAEPEDKSGTYFLVIGAQGFIAFYTEEALDKHLNHVNTTDENTRNRQDSYRKMSAAIEPVDTDKQGRVVIPARFRAHAKIVKDLVFVGMGDHFEIWAKDEYERYDSQISYDAAYSEVGFF